MRTLQFTIIPLLLLAASVSFADTKPDGQGQSTTSQKTNSQYSNEKTRACTKKLLTHSYGLAIENTQVMVRDQKVAKEILKKLVESGILGSAWLPLSLDRNKALRHFVNLDDPQHSYEYLSSVEGSGVRRKASQELLSQINSLFYLSQPLADKSILEEGARRLSMDSKQYILQRNILLQIVKESDFREFFRALLEDSIPNLVVSYDVLHPLANNIAYYKNKESDYTARAPFAVAKFLDKNSSRATLSWLSGIASYTYLIIHFDLSPEAVILGLVGFVIGSYADHFASTNFDIGIYRIFKGLSELVGVTQTHLHRKIFSPLYYKYKATGLRMQLNRFIRESKANYSAQLGLKTKNENNYLETVSTDRLIDGKYVSYTSEEKVVDIENYVSSTQKLLKDLDQAIESKSIALTISKAGNISTSLQKLFLLIVEYKGFIDSEDISQQIYALSQLSSSSDSPFRVLTNRIRERLLETKKTLTAIIEYSNSLHSLYKEFIQGLTDATSGDPSDFSEGLAQFSDGIIKQSNNALAESLENFIQVANEELMLSFRVEEMLSTLERDQTLKSNPESFKQHILELQQALEKNEEP